jgi:hypothetical protein
MTVTALRQAVTVLCRAGIVVCTIAGVSAQTVTFAPVGSIAGPADLVRVQGRYAYIAAGKTLTVVDVSNPAAPRQTGAYTFPEKIWGFRVVGSSVYVAADFFGLGILDVSDAGAPTLRGSMKTPGQAKNVAVFGTRAVVADHMSGVDYIDVSNPAKPVSLGSFFLDGYARDVVAIERRGDGPCASRSRGRRLTWPMGWRVCRSWISRPRRCRVSLARTRLPSRRAMWPSPTRSYLSLRVRCLRATCRQVMEKC